MSGNCCVCNLVLETVTSPESLTYACPEGHHTLTTETKTGNQTERFQLTLGRRLFWVVNRIEFTPDRRRQKVCSARLECASPGCTLCMADASDKAGIVLSLDRHIAPGTTSQALAPLVAPHWLEPAKRWQLDLDLAQGECQGDAAVYHLEEEQLETLLSYAARFDAAHEQEALWQNREDWERFPLSAVLEPFRIK